jgi:hypothetical protein
MSKGFEKRYTLLMLRKPTNWTNDPPWIRDYARALDDECILWMSQDPSPTNQESFREYIRPYLIQPWLVELDGDFYSRGTLTPEGIRQYIILHT